MKELWGKWRKLSTNEKMMIILIVALSIGLMTRWSYFVEEVKGLWDFYFSSPMKR